MAASTRNTGHNAVLSPLHPASRKRNKNMQLLSTFQPRGGGVM